jgi:hypothetical protein
MSAKRHQLYTCNDLSDEEGFKEEASKRTRTEIQPDGSSADGDEHDVKESVETAADHDDPFRYLLRCEAIDRSSGEAPQPLQWHSPQGYVPVQAEQSLVAILLHWKEKEGGMAKRLPHWRMREIRKGCRDLRVPLPAALSLRRHHIRQLRPYSSLEQLGLGTERQVREAAAVFERCVRDFLDLSRVLYWTEEHQRSYYSSMLKANGDEGRNSTSNRRPSPPTPDFVLQKPVLIQKYRASSSKGTGRQQHVYEEARVCWVEAKMFYGASTIPLDGKSAVGSLLRTAEKYVRCFGPGAMIFMHGCGDELARRLSAAGVLALDCSSKDTVALEPVHEHLRTWCANASGEILP